jgi:uncharacterized protein YwgA
MATAPFALAVRSSDDLAGILALAERQSGKAPLQFKGHDSELQRIFHTLQEETGLSLLDSFVFSSSGPDPYSPILSESVSKLQLSGLVGRKNPDYEILIVEPAAGRYYDSVLSQRLGPEEIEQLALAAKRFLELVERD